jgi:hypothetical protein
MQKSVLVLLATLLLAGCRKQKNELTTVQTVVAKVQTNQAQAQDTCPPYNAEELAVLDPTGDDDQKSTHGEDITAPTSERDTGKSPDYKRYVDCERKQHPPNLNFNFTRSSLGDGAWTSPPVVETDHIPIHLGMSRRDLKFAFIDGLGTFSIFTENYVAGLRHEEAGMDDVFQAINPENGRLIQHGQPGWWSVSAVFDEQDHLLHYEAEIYFPHRIFHTPEHSVRFARTQVGPWGPPDWQTADKMVWIYNKTFLEISAMDERKFAPEDGVVLSVTLAPELSQEVLKRTAW